MSDTENPIYRDSPDTPQGPHKMSQKPEPGHYCAWDHKEWAAQGLRDYADFEDVTYVNQEDFGDYYEGDWFYDDKDTLTIYYGSFGNYNAPGASSYTYADVYETLEEFEKELAEYESAPEYIDVCVDTENEEEPDEQDTDDEGIPF